MAATERWDAIVVGGGIAGAAAGCGLADRGRRVLIVEREVVAGVHATGRNAAILRHGFGPPSDLALARETRRVVLEGSLGPIGLRSCGTLHLSSRERLEIERDRLAAVGLESRILDPDEVARRMPCLSGSKFEAGLHCHEDGVLDVHALHQALLTRVRAGGGRLSLGTAVTRIRTDDAGVCGVDLDGRTIASRLVVDAAGPWSDDLAATAGGRRMGLRPCRRHILVTEPATAVDPDWPVAWDVDSPWYFRPEGGGLLISPGDEDLLEPCDCRESPAVIDRAVEKMVREVPGLASFRVSRSWAGLRTLSADGSCVVGFDPDVAGLFRVAGLGGHGISAAGGLLRIVPDLALDGGTDLVNAAEVSPARF